MFTKKYKTEVDKKELLLQTAARLFAEHGFEAVSTRMLAKESGVNMAMIAYYFGSKEKLFEAIIDERIPKMRETLLAYMESDLHPWDKLQAVIDSYVDKIFNSNSFSKLIYRELSLQQRPAHSERILNAIMLNWEIMAKIIEDGQQKGVFRTGIDVIMTLTTIFNTLTQIINAPCVLATVLHLEHEEDIFSEVYKNRLKTHLKQMLQAHLGVKS